MRLFGVQKAFIENLSLGTRFTPAKAKKIGLIDELVGSVEELVPAAKAWIKDEVLRNPEGTLQPWDVVEIIKGEKTSDEALARVVLDISARPPCTNPQDRNSMHATVENPESAHPGGPRPVGMPADSGFEKCRRSFVAER